MAGAWRMGRGAGLAFHLLLDGSPPTLSLACGAAPIPNPPTPISGAQETSETALDENRAGAWKTKCHWDMDCPRSTF